MYERAYINIIYISEAVIKKNHIESERELGAGHKTLNFPRVCKILESKS